MTDSHDFPADFPADPDGGPEPLRWTSGVIALTALALAVLNTEAIVSWTQELPAGPSTAKVMTAADAWHAGTAELGLNIPREKLHRTWKQAETMRWSESDLPERG